ncbi:hypothetical protein BC629DRAFT_554 [Irpex lacteus]|nr:hypothetical protein BC629DRAFT_554 [Irpex lacteus]
MAKRSRTASKRTKTKTKLKAKAPPDLPHLPNEILSLIIEALCPPHARSISGQPLISYTALPGAGSKAHLEACSLVSKRWRSITIPYFFKHIVLHRRHGFQFEELFTEGTGNNDTSHTRRMTAILGSVQALTLRGYFVVERDTMSLLLGYCTKLKYLDLECFHLREPFTQRRPQAVGLPSNSSYSSSDTSARRLDRLTFLPDPNGGTDEKLRVLAYILRHFSVNTLELRGLQSYHDDTNKSTLDPLEEAIAGAEELDVQGDVPFFLPTYSWCNVQPRITRLSLHISGSCFSLVLDSTNDLLRSLGHNLGELSLRISWKWCKRYLRDSDSESAPGILLPAALRTGFATLTKLHALRLNICSFIEDISSIEARVAKHAIYLAANFIPLLPAAERDATEKTTSVREETRLRHLVMQFSMQRCCYLSSARGSAFVPFSESQLRQLDWSALEPEWEKLRSNLCQHLFPSVKSNHGFNARTVHVFLCHGEDNQPCDDEEIRQHIRDALSEFRDALEAGEEGGYWGCKEEGCRWSKRMN